MCYQLSQCAFTSTIGGGSIALSATSGSLTDSVSSYRTRPILFSMQKFDVDFPSQAHIPITLNSMLSSSSHSMMTPFTPSSPSLVKQKQYKRNVSQGSRSNKDEEIPVNGLKNQIETKGSKNRRSLSSLEKRKNLFELQKEIGEDFLSISPEARENLRKKKIEQRREGLKAVYDAQSKADFDLSLTEIGLKRGFKGEDTLTTNEYKQTQMKLLVDNLWISTIGFSLVWYAFDYKTSLSFGVGCFLGNFYLLLLSRYVEGLGSGAGDVGKGGSARFALVILLVLIAGKFKNDINLIPELIGFSIYQLTTLLQAFDRKDP